MQTLAQTLKQFKSNGKPTLTYADLMEKRKQGSIDRCKQLEAEKAEAAKKAQIIENEAALGRTGILPIHQGSTFANYDDWLPGQKQAKQLMYNYAVAFNYETRANFILAGESRTGKNHLSAAVCNYLMPLGYKCLMITVNELMMQQRDCLMGRCDCSETEFMRKLILLDLLILDEIGLQRGTDNEKLALNYIIDQRTSNYKPTGMLTNLDKEQLIDDRHLGQRIMYRMGEGGLYIPFKWPAYQTNHANRKQLNMS